MRIRSDIEEPIEDGDTLHYFMVTSTADAPALPEIDEFQWDAKMLARQWRRDGIRRGPSRPMRDQRMTNADGPMSMMLWPVRDPDLFGGEETPFNREGRYRRLWSTYENWLWDDWRLPPGCDGDLVVETDVSLTMSGRFESVYVAEGATLRVRWVGFHVADTLTVHGSVTSAD